MFSPEALVNHCARSYVFAASLGAASIFSRYNGSAVSSVTTKANVKIHGARRNSARTATTANNNTTAAARQASSAARGGPAGW